MWLKRKVVMLPSKEKASKLWLRKKENKLYQGIDLVTDGSQQHLYILSDEKIKEGDYYIYHNQNCIWCNNEGTVPNKGAKKIIATTDKSLTQVVEILDSTGATKGEINLPEPSQQFIQKFIEEYNKGDIRKVKDSWSREEVISLLHRAGKYGRDTRDIDIGLMPSVMGKWIEQNL